MDRVVQYKTKAALLTKFTEQRTYKYKDSNTILSAFIEVLKFVELLLVVFMSISCLW